MADEWKEQYDYYFNKVNNANIESAKKQMEFQENMSNTAHQREVYDLIQAGLNPVLSANNGASSPMGAYANVDSSPISAKFASQNLKKELENARLITQMQNDNQMQIAMRQLAQQMQLGKYTVDQNNKTSRFNTIIDKYGVFAGLAYGLAEDMFQDRNLADQASALLDDHNYISGLMDSIDNSAKSAQDSIDSADKFISRADELLGSDWKSTVHKGENPNQDRYSRAVNGLVDSVIKFLYKTSPKDRKAPNTYQYKPKRINPSVKIFNRKYGNSSAK